MNKEFDCPKCGKVNPTALYYSCPMQADCPKCGAKLEKSDSIKILSEEEGRKLRPQFYEKKE
jgi:transcription initiation factor IIE alpha subunit